MFESQHYESNHANPRSHREYQGRHVEACRSRRIPDASRHIVLGTASFRYGPKFLLEHRNPNMQRAYCIRVGIRCRADSLGMKPMSFFYSDYGLVLVLTRYVYSRTGVRHRTESLGVNA